MTITYSFTLPHISSHAIPLTIPLNIPPPDPSHPTTSHALTLSNNILNNSAIGHISWPCALVLSYFLSFNSSLFIPNKPSENTQKYMYVVELGTGCGMVGVFLAKLLSLWYDQFYTNNKKDINKIMVVLTDIYPDVLQRAQMTINANLNQPHKKDDKIRESQIESRTTEKITDYHYFSISTQNYRWGSSQHPLLSLPKYHPQSDNMKKNEKMAEDLLIIAADVFFSANNVYSLLYTFYLSQSVCIITYQHRDTAIKSNIAQFASDLSLNVDILWSNNPITISYSLLHTVTSQNSDEPLIYRLKSSKSDSHQNDVTLYLPTVQLDQWTENVHYYYDTANKSGNNKVMSQIKNDSEIELWIIYPKDRYSVAK